MRPLTNIALMDFAVHAHKYLQRADWRESDIFCAIVTFEKHHGVKRARALVNFIATATERGEKKEMISVTLGHDLNHARDAKCLPRTWSYMERIKKEAKRQ